MKQKNKKNDGRKPSVAPPCSKEAEPRIDDIEDGTGDFQRRNPAKRVQKGSVPFRRLVERARLPRQREQAALEFLLGQGFTIVEEPRGALMTPRVEAAEQLEVLESLADYHETPDYCAGHSVRKNPEEAEDDGQDEEDEED